MDVQKWCPTGERNSFLTSSGIYNVMLQEVWPSSSKKFKPMTKGNCLHGDIWAATLWYSSDRGPGDWRYLKNRGKWEPLAGKDCILRLEEKQLDHTGLFYQGEESRFSSECKGQGRFKEGQAHNLLCTLTTFLQQMWRVDCRRGK